MRFFAYYLYSKRLKFAVFDERRHLQRVNKKRNQKAQMMIVQSICLIFCIHQSIAVNMSNFVPSFLQPGVKENSDSTAPAKPLGEVKSNTESTPNTYCNRDDSNNIFCNQNKSDIPNRQSINYNNDKNSDKTKVVDMTSTSAKTSSNQTALQDQHTRDALQQQQNNLSVPIKPSKNVDINVGQQQVQVKIKY